MGKTLRKHHPTARSRTTRSHKPRLLSDPSASSNNLTAQLRALGLYPADTLGDGNCLFRALSDQLYGSPSRHTHLRAEVCDYIAGHRGRYEGFCEDERGLDVHMRCMRELGTYGGHLELSAFAHMVKRNVKVVQPGLVYVIEWGAGLSEEERGAQMRVRAEEEENAGWEVASGTVYVAYHDWEHFSSIRNLAGPHAGLPNVREAPAGSEYDEDEGDAGYDAREREKERKKERKEKEKRKITRVKLKLSAPPSAASTPPPSQATTTSMSSSLTSLAPSPSVSSLPDSTLPTPPSSVALGSALSTSVSHDPASALPSTSTNALPSSSTLPSNTLLSSSTTSLAPLPSTSLPSSLPPPSTSLPSAPPTSIPVPPSVTASASALPLSMRIHRSPKRSFDESASSEDGGSVVSEDVERGRGVEKRSRVGSRVGSGSLGSGLVGEGHLGVEGMEGEMEREGGDREREAEERDEGGGDTEDEEKEVAASIIAPVAPAAHVTPQEIRDEGYSSLSELSDSDGDSVGEEGDAGGGGEGDEGGDGDGGDEGGEEQREDGGGDDGENASGKLKKKGVLKKGPKPGFEKRGYVDEDGRPLTRKERKARGLPKFRGVPGSSRGAGGSRVSGSHVGSGGGEGSGGRGAGGAGQRKSAGRIVIPGGRFPGKVVRKDGGAGRDDGGEEKEKEWVKTGVGRVDVRGFRELKI